MNELNHTPGQGDRHDDLLRRLVLLLEDGNDDPDARPSEEALQAFLSGKATGQQANQVLEALEKSRHYRKEVADIVSDLESLQKGAEIQPPESELPELPAMIRKHIDELPSGKIFRIGGITSFLAAAILIVTAVALLVPGAQEFSLLAESLERNTLIGLHSRSDSNSVPRAFESAQEAALAAFREALTYDNAEFLPRSSRPHSTSLTAGQQYTLTIDYPLTSMSISYDVKVAPSVAEASVPQFYLLTLPSRNLYTLVADKASISARWSMGRAEYVCLALVYPTDGGFSATPAQVFSTK